MFESFTIWKSKLICSSHKQNIYVNLMLSWDFTSSFFWKMDNLTIALLVKHRCLILHQKHKHWATFDPTITLHLEFKINWIIIMHISCSSSVPKWLYQFHSCWIKMKKKSFSCSKPCVLGKMTALLSTPPKEIFFFKLAWLMIKHADSLLTAPPVPFKKCLHTVSCL